MPRVGSTFHLMTMSKYAFRIKYFSIMVSVTFLNQLKMYVLFNNT